MSVSPFFNIPQASEMAGIVAERLYQRYVEAVVEGLKRSGSFDCKDSDPSNNAERLHREHGDTLLARGYLVFKNGDVKIPYTDEVAAFYLQATFADYPQAALAKQENIQVISSSPEDLVVVTADDHAAHIQYHQGFMDHLKPGYYVWNMLQRHISEHMRMANMGQNISAE